MQTKAKQENFEGGTKQHNFGQAQKALRIISLVLLALCLGFGIYFYNAKNVLHDPYPTIGDFGFSIVISGSMQPAINVDDAVFTKAENTYCTNDVIVYIDENGKSAVVHRIVDIDKNGNYITKGDANNSVDKPVSESMVKGKVIFTLPKIGLLFTEVGAYTILAISLIFLLVSLISEWGYRKEKQKYMQNLQASINELKAANKTKYKF